MKHTIFVINTDESYDSGQGSRVEEKGYAKLSDAKNRIRQMYNAKKKDYDVYEDSGRFTFDFFEDGTGYRIYDEEDYNENHECASIYEVEVEI